MTTNEDNASRWCENMLKSGDRYLLHGIGVRPSSCECHPGEDFVIPRLSPLLAAMQDHPESHEFQWLEEAKKWVAILPNLNGG